jgi:aminoglycoside phosphotransferase (APT) family kinase protein
MAGFDPIEHRAQCEHYLGRALGAGVRLVAATRLQQSTRAAPWRLDVEVDGEARAYVLKLDPRRMEHEYRVLRALESLPLPAPRAYGWDPEGTALGRPCFFEEFVAGESLLPPLIAARAWAEDLYLDTACALQAITREQLAPVAGWLGAGESAADVLDDAYRYFQAHPQALAGAAYARLRATMPALPEVRFSNGDLWPDNLLVRDGRLAGVVDWALAGFSDPLYEFLLPFFLRPELRGRGLEERYCRRLGLDPGLLSWYHGLEFFDSWRWVLVTGQPYEQHTVESLAADLARWLDEA